MIAESRVTLRRDPTMYVRALQRLAETAGRFRARVSIGNDGRTADAKSIIQLLTLAARQGVELTIQARGDDAEAAVSTLDGYLQSAFGGDHRPPPVPAG